MKSVCDLCRSRNGEKGQVLPLVLIAVTIGTLLVTPFVGNVGSSLLGSRIFGTRINEQYSADSGVEHAIWRLTDDGLTGQLTVPGNSVSYNLGESINGKTPAVTVSNAWETMASDDFESGGWAGGTGWLAAWTHTGDSSIVTTGTPRQGTYHLMLRANTGYVARSVDVRGPSARLQFWAKANSFEGGETAQALISPNGSDWTAVYTWVNGNDDNAYHYYDLDLSSYELTSQFWIAFQANMSNTFDYFYVDNLKVVWLFGDDYLEKTIAEEYFESGDWSGGVGWLADWTYSGTASVTTSGTPYEGSYHLLLQNNTGYAKRSVDLSAYTDVRLRFWAKVNTFETGETAECLVSSNGTDWTTVYTWTSADSDNTYYYYDIDLSSYSLTSQFWIAFQANVSSTFDYFYVDSMQIVDVEGVIRDDFESGNWSGGTGWLADWTNSGDSSVTNSGTPFEGSYHLRLRSTNGDVSRSADLSARTEARLQFWWKANSFEAGETAECLVSENGTAWTVVHTWVDGDDDNAYHFIDIDLSPYELTSQFWIRFRSNMSNAYDYFYVDDLRIVDANQYGITSKAGDGVIKAVVKIISGVPSVILWWLN